MDTATPPNEALAYLPEDINRIASLLAEYTEKLIDNCQQISSQPAIFIRIFGCKPRYLRQQFLKRRSQLIAEALTRLIQIASQMQEHGRMSQALRMALDLRLTEAELAMEYCQLVANGKH